MLTNRTLLTAVKEGEELTLQEHTAEDMAATLAAIVVGRNKLGKALINLRLANTILEDHNGGLTFWHESLASTATAATSGAPPWLSPGAAPSAAPLPGVATAMAIRADAARRRSRPPRR